MNHVLSFAFIGGDLRQLRVISGLLSEGHNIKTFALNTDSLFGVENATSLSDCIHGADVVVLPLPYSSSPKMLNAEISVGIGEIFSAMEKGQILLAGRTDNYLKALAELHQVRLADYMEREEFSVLNTIPTVEGALEIAMRETPYTLHASKCLVLGYGRIGKLLSKSLHALGAITHVSARKHSDLAWIKAQGMTGIKNQDLIHLIGNYQIIFNTIPVTVLDYHMLSKIPNDCLIIDLASKPGGVDFNTARDLGKKVIWALSLPGKVAPQTAGDIMKDTIINILTELGV